MNGTAAAFLLLAVCALLAILLVTGVIGSVLFGSLFAIALVILGGSSNGFRKKSPPTADSSESSSEQRA